MAVEEETITLARPVAVGNSGTKLGKLSSTGGSLKANGCDKEVVKSALFTAMPDFTLGVDTEEARPSDVSELNLPNLFFENPNLRPLQSFMVHHKRREGWRPFIDVKIHSRQHVLMVKGTYKLLLRGFFGKVTLFNVFLIL